MIYFVFSPNIQQVWSQAYIVGGLHSFFSYFYLSPYLVNGNFQNYIILFYLLAGVFFNSKDRVFPDAVVHLRFLLLQKTEGKLHLAVGDFKSAALGLLQHSLLADSGLFHAGVQLRQLLEIKVLLNRSLLVRIAPYPRDNWSLRYFVVRAYGVMREFNLHRDEDNQERLDVQIEHEV